VSKWYPNRAMSFYAGIETCANQISIGAHHQIVVRNRFQKEYAEKILGRRNRLDIEIVVEEG
jgi:hypothetical protein